MEGSHIELLRAAVSLIESRCKVTPQAAIVLGSGLGGLADRIDVDAVIPYQELPGFAVASASGHRGQLILGKLGSTEVVVMAGRFHRYEGWTYDQITWPVRVMHALGANSLIVSNAAGGVSPKLQVGDIVVIRDHLNWLGTTIGMREKAASSGTEVHTIGRHADVYDCQLAELAMRIATEHHFRAYFGTYLATLGPNYETRSEYRMMRRLGADVVGMSTVPEVLLAASLPMRTLGLSMVSNVANPDLAVKADHADVLAAGHAAEKKMEAIVSGVLCHLAQLG